MMDDKFGRFLMVMLIFFISVAALLVLSTIIFLGFWVFGEVFSPNQC